MKKICALLMALLLSLSAGCGTMDPDEAQESIQVIAMDTAMIFTAYGVNSTKADYAAEEEVYRLEAMLSRTDEESQVARLNSQGTADIDAELWGLIETAMAYSEATGGAFDITVAPVLLAWGFTTDEYQVPSQAELEALLPAVGVEHIRCLGENTDGTVTVALDPGTQIDLGAIGKGYASDRVAAIFEEYEVPRGLIRLGGSVLAIGDRPDGEAWRVGIQDPDSQEGGYLAIVEVADQAVVTSGDYQRYFEQDGQRYCHIMDPATAAPADSGVDSVTIVGSDGTVCDALSTALYVMGEEKGAQFWKDHPELNFEAIFVSQDGSIAVTAGLEDHFTLADGYQDREVTVIER